MHFKGKMLGNKNVYEKDMIDNVDRVEFVIKKFTAMKEHSAILLKGRDQKFSQAAKMLTAYGAQTRTEGPNAYLRAVGTFLEKIAANHKANDLAIFEAFTVKLQSWLGANQKNMEMQIKHMEDLRKEMQKTDKKASKDAQLSGSAEATKDTWSKYCEETTEVIKKFMANAEEFKKYTDAWIQKEKEIDIFNREQCQGAVSLNKGRKSGTLATASIMKKPDTEEKKEEEEEEKKEDK